jgi:predicted DNA-binding helix-hairpin-helix protein
MTSTMDAFDKLQLLGAGQLVADRDACTAGSCGIPQVRAPRERSLPGIYRAAVPGKGRIPLLRVLMTNVCQFDCRYCAINCHRDVWRSSYTPEELVATFMELYRRGAVDGLFLTSGVAGDAGKVESRMLDAVSILRQREGFKGYIHLKMMPGVPPDHIEWAAGMVDRLSINLEAPTPEHLARIAPKKAAVTNALAAMETVRFIQDRLPHLLKAGQTTQLVVGAAGESDKEILERSRWLYGHMRMRRVYYSAYQPVCGEELAPPAPPAREHRLYQSDWLLRRYPIPLDELLFDDFGNLPLAADPKLIWALRHPENFPKEVNRATYRELLQVPGVGPLSARRIVDARRGHRFRELSELQTVGVVTKRARHFLLLHGRYFGGRDVMASQLMYEPDESESYQMSLWDRARSPQPPAGVVLAK